MLTSKKETERQNEEVGGDFWVEFGLAYFIFARFFAIMILSLFINIREIEKKTHEIVLKYVQFA